MNWSSVRPLLKHTCGESNQLPWWPYTLAKVSHHRLISGNVYHICLCQMRIRQNPLWLWNPEDTSPEVWNRGGPKNGHVSNKERTNSHYFSRANQQKAGTKIYSLTQCSLTVNECDWHILAATSRELIHIVWLEFFFYKKKGLHELLKYSD